MRLYSKSKSTRVFVFILQGSEKSVGEEGGGTDGLRGSLGNEGDDGYEGDESVGAGSFDELCFVRIKFS